MFHFMKFFDSRPNNRSGRVLDVFSLIWLFRLFLVIMIWDLKIWNKSGGKKWISLCDFFGSAPKVHSNSLRAAEAPHFFHLGHFKYPKLKEFGHSSASGISLIFDLG